MYIHKRVFLSQQTRFIINQLQRGYLQSGIPTEKRYTCCEGYWWNVDILRHSLEAASLCQADVCC